MRHRGSRILGKAPTVAATKAQRTHAKPITDRALRDAYKAFSSSPLNSSPGPLKHSRRPLLRGDDTR